MQRHSAGPWQRLEAGALSKLQQTRLRRVSRVRASSSLSSSARSSCPGRVVTLKVAIAPKRLEMLHELFPSATRFALLVNPTNPAWRRQSIEGVNLLPHIVASEPSAHGANIGAQRPFLYQRAQFEPRPRSFGLNRSPPNLTRNFSACSASAKQ